MVESTLFESRPDGERIGRRKKPATLAMSAVVHVLLCGVLILIPLMQTQAVPPVALPPPPVQLTSPTRFVKLAAVRPAGGGSSRPAPAPSVAALPEPMIDPTAIPDKIAYIADAIYIGSDASFRGGPNGSSIGVGPGGPGVLGGTGTGDAPSFAPPPPPPAPPVPPAPKILVREPIRVSGGHQNSLLVHRVDPVYPSLARTARVEGTVIAEARISTTGTIEDLRIISGHPLFHKAVQDALKQWRYRPTLLNGEPIDVITTITVNFTLSQSR